MQTPKRGRRCPADTALLAELGALLQRLDPVPDTVIAAAEAAGCLLHLDEDVRWLEALLDSATDPLVGVRGSCSARRLDFCCDDTMLSVEFAANDHGGMRLVGLLEPVGEPVTVSVMWSHGHAESTVDTLGCFRVDGVPTGPVRIEVHRKGCQPMATGWFVA